MSIQLGSFGTHNRKYRCTLHLQWSLAVFHTASADSPEPTSICRTHIFLGFLFGAATNVCCQAYDQSEHQQPGAGQHELGLVVEVDGHGQHGHASSLDVAHHTLFFGLVQYV